MVTIYTERGPAEATMRDLEREERPFHFWKATSLTLVAGLLMSLAACFNLSNDVNDLTQNKLPELQGMIAAQFPAAR